MTYNQTEKKRRLALYVFWDEKGLVRNYVKFYLRALKGIAESVICIANGGITAAGKAALEEMEIAVMERPNEGFDFAAWQTVLLKLGWNKVSNFDELILCNCSCYGPVYPLEEAFAVMANRDCDFWGMTRHPERRDIQIIANDSSSVIYEHIHSYFIVCRKGAIINDAFKQWWEKLESFNDFHSEVAYHECRFTKYLEEEGGLKWECFADAAKYDVLTKGENALMFQPLELLKDRMPLVKRELFADTVEWLTPLSVGQQPRQVLDFLAEHTDYPVAQVWEDLLATRKMSTVKDALHLNYILPSEHTNQYQNHCKKVSVALICYAYYPDLACQMSRYIASMPDTANIYIISPRKDTLDAYRNELSNFTFANVEFIIKENRGRDISALLITAKEIIANHDIICYIHDKKTKQASPIVVNDFIYHCMECCLNSKPYVKNIIHAFYAQKYLGLICPPTVYFGSICPLGAELHNNEKSILHVHNLLKLSTPIDDSTVAPFGTCFWARSKALQALYRRNWVHDDFPEEPLAPDGTISHGIERIIPMVAQESGYYTAWCSPDTYASLYMNNTAFMLREYNRRLSLKYGLRPWNAMLKAMEEDIAAAQQQPIIDMTSQRKRLRRKRRQYRLINILTMGITYRMNKKKLREYRDRLGL